MDYEKKYDDYLNKAITNYDIAGLSVGVWTEDGSPLDSAGFSYEKAFGKADFETGADLTPNHFSHMASISKTLTACGALMLYEDGLIRFEEKLSDLLPWIEINDKRFRDINFKHLITHTAGLPSVDDYHWTTPDIDGEALKRYALSDDVREAIFVNSPGENIFSYSDMGFEILGNIIQEISGMAYEEFIADKLLKPCGMDDSTMLVFKRTEKGQNINPDFATREDINDALTMDDLLKSGLAMPHMKDENNYIVRQPYYPYNRRHAPSSTLNANIFELKKYGDAHMNREILSLKTYENMWKTQTIVQNNGEGMGLGWFVGVQNGYTLYGHEGMDDGFRASFWICPELRTQIVVLSNIGKAPVKKISKTLFDYLTLK